jgi:hypothetical protein
MVTTDSSGVIDDESLVNGARGATQPGACAEVIEEWLALT